MSITIRHLEGPLKGKAKFDDTVPTILFGGAGAQVEYPEEESAVGEKHLRLNRDQDGSYSVELGEGCHVEIDGKPAKNGARVESGSVVRLGRDGPTFEVLLPGVTVHHLTGPFAGQHQYFPYGTKKIVIGREPEKHDITYPEVDECGTVGRLHCSLTRNDLGNYCVGLTADHYVGIDGVEAENGAVVRSGGIFRLGDDKGPSFDVVVEEPKKLGKTTKINKPTVPVRKRVENAIRYGTYAVGALVVLFAVGLGLSQWQRSDLVAQLNELQNKTGELAANEFSEAALKNAEAAVYLVVKKIGNNPPIPMATAWAFAPDMLATNAHVTEKIDGNEGAYFLVARNGQEIQYIPITDAISHPGHAAFSNYKQMLISTGGKKFEPLDVISQYDVGIIKIDPKTPLPATLDLATDEDLENLPYTTPVALIGYPTEGLAGTDVKFKAPPNRQFGYISALTNVFMCSADQDNQLLIQHSVPVAGGVSGSPLLMPKDGKIIVIGIVAGGNVTGIGDDKRIPNAALINFADRIDLLRDLRDGVAKQNVDKDQADYWPKASEGFAQYFDVAAKAFVNLTTDRYKVAEPVKVEEIGQGPFDPGAVDSPKFFSNTYTFEAKPGFVYGFIINAKSGVPLTLNVKEVKPDGTTEFYRAAEDNRKMSVPELAPTAWVTKPMKIEIIVSGLTEQRTDYALMVYEWKQPPAPATTDPSATPPQQ